MNPAIAWRPPSGPDVQMLPAGRWWDAVQVPSYLGALALDELGSDTGAVIEDGYGALYWLVPPNAADDWGLQGIAVRGETTYLAVPPQHRTKGPGLRWRVLLTPTRYLADPDRLHDALAAAVAKALGPRTPRQCCRCHRTTPAPVPVRIIHAATGPGRTVYACQVCAPHIPPGPDDLGFLEAAQRRRETR
ncbi:hypothetical protein [Streptomyces gobiensis]|uniref:hypothetical protein n=1 Tax=Streptomyces gobiensis TaxID=2875706 RepID=UPI001E3296CB|nr:hypothetical protein [Streptomyces gobiensis]UGY91038.1 hypothetical protein test1122_04405 [Streptomyces gobiensis]